MGFVNKRWDTIAPREFNHLPVHLKTEMKAASVVILMEAQFKPSTEWQAIARVHRMGQSRTVNVHRILASNTIEEHLVQLIEKKANLFMAYAHENAVKDSSDMASDPDTGSLERELLRLMRAEDDEIS